MFPKPTRNSSPKNLKKVREDFCVILICRRKKVDAAHIKSRGAGGGDEEFNIISLCRTHHSKQHQLGWQGFALRYPEVMKALSDKGWIFIEGGKLTRRDVV